jgi:hypothetical protein
MSFEILISLLALGLSLLSLYLSSFKPFSLKITAAGRYMLSLKYDSRNPYQTAISVDLIFSNTGSRIGVINNLGLRLIDEHEKTVIMVPYLIVSSLKIHLGGATPFPEVEAFRVFNLNPGESTEKRIMFVLNKDARYLPVGRYKAEVFGRGSRELEMTRYLAVTIEIDETDDKIIHPRSQATNLHLEVTPREKVVPELEEEWIRLESLDRTEFIR